MSPARGPLSRRTVAILWALMITMQLVFAGFMAWDEITDSSRARANFQSSPQAMHRDAESPATAGENAESDLDGPIQVYPTGA